MGERPTRGPHSLPIVSDMICSVQEFGELAGEVLATGSSLRFEATGWSMHPCVRHGDRLLIAPLQHGEPRTGDVVLARLDDGRLVVHRIVRRQRRGRLIWFLLKGDRNVTADGWLPAGALLGRVAAIQRPGGPVAWGGRMQRLAGVILAGVSLLGLRRYRLVRRAYRLQMRLRQGRPKVSRGAA
jgi:signal peptidase I